MKEGSKASDLRVESIQYGSELRECGAVFSECNEAILVVDKIEIVTFKLVTNSFWLSMEAVNTGRTAAQLMR
jgi:hypothetical protein